ncbi:hypothetical protein J6590_001963 [Homalodisca vitripennis]|nr:hypothetical protein J6590_001963 [Homalodisca vitripennis]
MRTGLTDGDTGSGLKASRTGEIQRSIALIPCIPRYDITCKFAGSMQGYQDILIVVFYSVMLAERESWPDDLSRLHSSDRVQIDSVPQKQKQFASVPTVGGRGRTESVVACVADITIPLCWPHCFYANNILSSWHPLFLPQLYHPPIFTFTARVYSYNRNLELYLN